MFRWFMGVWLIWCYGDVTDDVCDVCVCVRLIVSHLISSHLIQLNDCNDEAKFYPRCFVDRLHAGDQFVEADRSALMKLVVDIFQIPGCGGRRTVLLPCHVWQLFYHKVTTIQWFMILISVTSTVAESVVNFVNLWIWNKNETDTIWLIKRS